LKVLVDTNVLLDVLLRRVPFHTDALHLLARVERNELQGVLGATTVTTLYYFLDKGLGASRAREELRKLLTLFDVAAVNRGVLSRALDAPLADYEDAVLVEAAGAIGADAVVTRNVKDFKNAPLTVYTPRELLSILEATQ